MNRWIALLDKVTSVEENIAKIKEETKKILIISIGQDKKALEIAKDLRKNNIDSQNINNNDIWLYKLDSSGNETESWTSVSNFEANNIIYNSVNKNIINLRFLIFKNGFKY